MLVVLIILVLVAAVERRTEQRWPERRAHPSPSPNRLLHGGSFPRLTKPYAFKHLFFLFQPLGRKCFLDAHRGAWFNRLESPFLGDSAPRLRPTVTVLGHFWQHRGAARAHVGSFQVAYPFNSQARLETGDFFLENETLNLCLGETKSPGATCS